MIAISAMARIAVITLHCVIPKQIKESGRRASVPAIGRKLAGFHGAQQNDLLLGAKRGEGLGEFHAAGTIEESEAVAISILPAEQGTAKLDIDEVDDASPVRAGIVIGRMSWSEIAARVRASATVRKRQGFRVAIRRRLRLLPLRQLPADELATGKIFVPAHERVSNKVASDDRRAAR